MWYKDCVKTTNMTSQNHHPSLILEPSLVCCSLQGTHPSLKSNQNAKATVTAIIDGTGSLGAAIGPLLVGPITNNNQVSHTLEEEGPLCQYTKLLKKWDFCTKSGS